jgi:hypothetical protein
MPFEVEIISLAELQLAAHQAQRLDVDSLTVDELREVVRALNGIERAVRRRQGRLDNSLATIIRRWRLKLPTRGSVLS